ncbi:MAG: membrane protein [Candidatus Azotimanducaceae bacterium]|jgi:membrane protein
MRDFLDTAWEAAHLWYHKDANHMAATVSYYSLFAIVPLLVLTVAFIGLLYGKDFAASALYGWGTVLGNDLVTLLRDAMVNLEGLSAGYGFSILATLIFSVMTIVFFNTFTSGIHRLWSLSPHGVEGWMHKTRNSLLFFIVLEVYLLSLVGLEAIVGLLIENTGMSVFYVVETLFFIVVTTVLFSLAYRILPWETPATKSRLYGAFVASVLFAVAKSVVTWYVHTTPIPGLFGAAGLMLVFLIWIYITACILYYGAAFAHVHGKRHQITT